MTFKRFVETGRIGRISRGRYKGKLVAIVDVIDQNRVLIDGPLNHVPRQAYPVNHLYLTKYRVKFPFSAPTRIVRKALEKFNLKDKWSQSEWAAKSRAKRKRVNLNDFERFRVRLAKRERNQIVTPVFKKLKSSAITSGLFFGKPVKGTASWPQVRTIDPTLRKKKVKKVKKTKKVAKKAAPKAKK